MKCHILDDCLYKISRISKSIETESKLVVGRDSGEGWMGNDCLMRWVSIWGEQKHFRTR